MERQREVALGGTISIKLMRDVEWEGGGGAEARDYHIGTLIYNNFGN